MCSDLTVYSDISYHILAFCVHFILMLGRRQKQQTTSTGQPRWHDQWFMNSLEIWDLDCKDLPPACYLRESLYLSVFPCPPPSMMMLPLQSALRSMHKEKYRKVSYCHFSEKKTGKKGFKRWV